MIATCVCGGTSIELPEPPTHATQCNCSYCSRVGGLWSYVAVDAPIILRDEFGAVFSASGFNQHHFCTRCGCQTYGISPDWSLGETEVPSKKKFAINARLLDNFHFEKLVIEPIDGRHLW